MSGFFDHRMFIIACKCSLSFDVQLYECTTICLFILLLINILLVCTLELLCYLEHSFAHNFGGHVHLIHLNTYQQLHQTGLVLHFGKMKKVSYLKSSLLFLTLGWALQPELKSTRLKVGN